MRRSHFSCLLLVAHLAGCGAEPGRGVAAKKDMGSGVGGGGMGDDGGVTPLLDGSVYQPPDGGVYQPPDGMVNVEDPKDCAEAAANKSYIGCDYWPTVTANPVWSIFDFAVVVSNPGTAPAMVTVTGPKSTNKMVTVMPGTLTKIYLPWVTELKGPDTDSLGQTTPLTQSARKDAGAYHLVSSLPVLVYQFSALEYQGKGGPAGKSWSSCPGTASGIGCFSFTNDASLLLPSTAMTGNYRVATSRGMDDGSSAFVAITATTAGTTVKIKTPASSNILAGTGVPAVAANATSSFTMNAGDVVQLVGKSGKAGDLSGMLVQADQPVQVIGGMPCFANPADACDHLEETVMPVETLGKRYAVTMPTGPKGAQVSATVRFVGNQDATTLQYSPAVAGAPTTLQAGQVVEIETLKTDFLVTGDKEFIVSTVQKSGSVVDASLFDAKGDPSLSHAIAVEQYRLKYVFLAPDDYDSNYADIVAPAGATLVLDGAALTAAGKALGTTGYQVVRVKLGLGTGGAHTLSADQPIGLQIMGYGSYTSYQYPGGLNLITITPPPPPIP